jgi:hypothetical protein
MYTTMEKKEIIFFVFPCISRISLHCFVKEDPISGAYHGKKEEKTI